MKKFGVKIGLLLAVCTLMLAVATAAFASQNNQLVKIDLWNAYTNQASMGNIALDNNPKALYNPETKTLQIATNGVDVSGYISGITAARYDVSGSGDYVDVNVLSTSTVESGTKNDGINHTVEFLSCFEIQIPDYITGSGVEYIPLQMAVPYTPMDVVVGTGYLDSKLRIDWNDVTETSSTELAIDVTISSGTVEDVKLGDGGFVINADTTILMADSIFAVEEIKSGANYELAKAALGAEVGNFELYLLSITLGGVEVEPNGSLEIIFPYGEIETLYRINDNGNKTLLRGSVEHDGYTIVSRSLGLFAVVDGEALEVENTEIDQPKNEDIKNETTTSFTDIAGHWAESNIMNMVAAALFNGTSQTAFSPNASMTNAMVITVLHRIAGEPTVAHDGALWYSEAMAWGYENEIIGGYTEFNGSANVSREQLATMIYRYEMLNGSASSKNDLSAFSDSSEISDWAKDGLSWANAVGVVTGSSPSTIAPLAEATRGEVATMLWRYINL